MADITKVQLGVCSVVYNGLDLGHTFGGVEVIYKPTHKDLMVDLYGDTKVEQILVGEMWTAKVPLAEYTIANLRNAFPQSVFGGAGNTRITIGAKAGKSGKAVSYPLTLHPVSQGTKAFDVNFYKAYVSSQITLKHTNKDEKVIEVVFEALLDETRSDGNYLGMIGDSTT
jgi:hypothetical protein